MRMDIDTDPVSMLMSEEMLLPRTSYDFVPFPKMSRLFRPIVITEKIDGTNAAVCIDDMPPYGYGDEEVVGPGIVINVASYEVDPETGVEIGWKPVFVYAQSRKQIISPERDNFGFAKWVREHARELADGLGVGVHFGEWWGSGIQRKYDLDEKRFSLFNTSRWAEAWASPDRLCHVVPVLMELEEFDTAAIKGALLTLESRGSYAAPGFKDPEGIVVFHKASNTCFKATIKNDDKGKDHGA